MNPARNHAMDQNQQQSQLKLLIAKGKEQGYLTYAEVNDHLPSDIVDPEQIEDIVSMINDMGIQVYETAPDAETLLEANPNVDELAAEEAAAALASVENEFGRTTDPVRMYMRDMGAVDLLTRADEIEIAKRIEDGLNQMLSSLAMFPNAVAELISLYDEVAEGKRKLTDLLTAFIDPNAPDNIPTPAEVAAANAAKAESGRGRRPFRQDPQAAQAPGQRHQEARAPGQEGGEDPQGSDRPDHGAEAHAQGGGSAGGQHARPGGPHPPAREGHHGTVRRQGQDAAQGVHHLLPGQRGQSRVAAAADRLGRPVRQGSQATSGRDPQGPAETGRDRGMVRHHHRRHQGHQPQDVHRRSQGPARQEGDGSPRSTPTAACSSWI